VGGREDVFFVDLWFGVLRFGMLFGPFLISRINHLGALAAEHFVEVFLDALIGSEGLVGEGLVEFGENFHGAFEEVEVFVLHLEGSTFFAEVEGALAEFEFLLALEVARQVAKGGLIKSGSGHGVEGVGLNEDFERGFGIGIVRAEFGDEFGGGGNFFGEVVFVVEAVEDAEAEPEVQAIGTGLGGELNDFCVGVTEGEPMDDLGLVFGREVGESVVGAGGLL